MHTAILISALLSATPLPPPRCGQLRLRLLDFETREAAAALVRVSEGGANYGPHLGRTGWFPLRGSIKLSLAPGRYRVQVSGGRRRLPYDKHVDVFSGKLAALSVYVKMPAYLAFERSGWLCLDPLYSAGDQPPARAALTAESLGISAVGLERLPTATAGKIRTSMPLLRWSGRADLRMGSRCEIVPAKSSGQSTPLARFYADCGRPRRFNPWRRAVPWRPELSRFYDLLASRPLATRGVAPRMYYELLAGKDTGGFELDGSDSAQKLWFALLKRGHRVPAVAGSRGLLSSGDNPEPRMLINLGKLGDLVPKGTDPAELIVRAVKSGRSTLSFGPFCFLNVDGRTSGSELPTEEKDRRIKILAAASTDRKAEVSRVVLFRDGRIFRDIKVPPGRTAFNLNLVVRQDEPCWLVAKCWQRIRGSRRQETVAITNPVWLESKAYSTRPKAVKTKVRARVIDADTGALVGGAVVRARRRGAGLRLVGAKGLVAPNQNHQVRWDYRCPTGTFGVDLHPDVELCVSAPGYDAVKFAMFDKLGLSDFARKYAAMPPAEVESKLCDPLTFALLRQALRHCDITVKLYPKTAAK